jgi:hypothetical protein
MIRRVLNKRSGSMAISLSAAQALSDGLQTHLEEVIRMSLSCCESRANSVSQEVFNSLDILTNSSVHGLTSPRLTALTAIRWGTSEARLRLQIEEEEARLIVSSRHQALRSGLINILSVCQEEQLQNHRQDEAESQTEGTDKRGSDKSRTATTRKKKKERGGGAGNTALTIRGADEIVMHSFDRAQQVLDAQRSNQVGVVLFLTIDLIISYYLIQSLSSAPEGCQRRHTLHMGSDGGTGLQGANIKRAARCTP